MDAEHRRRFPHRRTQVRRVTGNVFDRLSGSGSSPSVFNSDDEENNMQMLERNPVVTNRRSSTRTSCTSGHNMKNVGEGRHVTVPCRARPASKEPVD
jgi:hypothetical protein